MSPLMNSYDLALLTPEQVAERLGCETDTVNAKAAAHELPAIKYGRSWRFPVEAMNRYLAEKALEHVRAPRAKPADDKVVDLNSGRPDLSKVVRVAPQSVRKVRASQ